jgi:hypothetical protein
MSSNPLLKFRHKKRDFPVGDGLGLCYTGSKNNLDSGLQSAVVVGKPLGYLPDGDAQHFVLRYFDALTPGEVILEGLEGKAPTAVVCCTHSFVRMAYAYEVDGVAGNRAQESSKV